MSSLTPTTSSSGDTRLSLVHFLNTRLSLVRFPQNFPKSFPEAPVAGEEVRLECIAFGYPVPHYNWTRVGADLPRGSYITNHNRVLIIPR